MDVVVVALVVGKAVGKVVVVGLEVEPGLEGMVDMVGNMEPVLALELVGNMELELELVGSMALGLALELALVGSMAIELAADTMVVGTMGMMELVEDMNQMTANQSLSCLASCTMEVHPTKILQMIVGQMKVGYMSRSLVEELELELGMVMGLGMELELGMALGLGMELEPGMELELGLGSLKRHRPMSCIEEGLPIADLHRSQLRRRILVVGTKLHRSLSLRSLNHQNRHHRSRLQRLRLDRIG